MTRIEIAETDIRRVEAYLPRNYHLTGEVRHSDLFGRDCLIAEGTDNAGWTATGYVIPRLASGLISARIVT